MWGLFVSARPLALIWRLILGEFHRGKERGIERERWFRSVVAVGRYVEVNFYCEDCEERCVIYQQSFQSVRQEATFWINMSVGTPFPITIKSICIDIKKK